MVDLEDSNAFWDTNGFSKENDTQRFFNGDFVGQKAFKKLFGN